MFDQQHLNSNMVFWLALSPALPPGPPGEGGPFAVARDFGSNGLSIAPGGGQSVPGNAWTQLVLRAEGDEEEQRDDQAGGDQAGDGGFFLAIDHEPNEAQNESERSAEEESQPAESCEGGPSARPQQGQAG